MPPLLGDPRPDPIAYCDARNWEGLEALVRDVRRLGPGDVEGRGLLLVEGDAWRRGGASLRSGVASFASKCRLDGAPLVVRDTRSGETLGDYDPATGYRPRS